MRLRSYRTVYGLVSSFISDPYGRVLFQTKIYETVVAVGEARFLRTETIYGRTGDVFAYASVIVSIAALVVSRRGIQ